MVQLPLSTFLWWLVSCVSGCCISAQPFLSLITLPQQCSGPQSQRVSMLMKLAASSVLWAHFRLLCHLPQVPFTDSFTSKGNIKLLMVCNSYPCLLRGIAEIVCLLIAPFLFSSHRETVEDTPAAVFFVVIGVKCVMLLILFVVAFLSKKTEKQMKEDEREPEDLSAQEKMLKKDAAPIIKTLQAKQGDSSGSDSSSTSSGTSSDSSSTSSSVKK